MAIDRDGAEPAPVSSSDSSPWTLAQEGVPSAGAIGMPAVCYALDRANHAAELLHRAAQYRASAAVTSLPDMAGILHRLSTAFDDAAHQLLDEIGARR